MSPGSMDDVSIAMASEYLTCTVFGEAPGAVIGAMVTNTAVGMLPGDSTAPMSVNDSTVRGCPR